jgi:isocitrate lyase
VQFVKAGAKGIYVSGRQVAGDANLAGDTYPSTLALKGSTEEAQFEGASARP